MSDLIDTECQSRMCLNPLHQGTKMVLTKKKEEKKIIATHRTNFKIIIRNNNTITQVSFHGTSMQKEAMRSIKV